MKTGGHTRPRRGRGRKRGCEGAKRGQNEGDGTMGATEMERGGDVCRGFGGLSLYVRENVGKKFGGVGKWVYLCSAK